MKILYTKIFFVEQCIKRTNKSSALSLWFYVKNECYAYKTDMLNKIINVLFLRIASGL